jgi:gas vesicle structural protein
MTRRPRTYSTVSRRSRHSTVAGKPPARPEVAHPPQRPPVPKLTLSSPKGRAPANRHVARIIGGDESTLLDVLDNLLSKGVVLNADVILALANVDLVYLRLSAILCAADRVLPRSRR